MNLWIFQCSFGHSTEQYAAVLHPAHILNFQPTAGTVLQVLCYSPAEASLLGSMVLANIITDFSKCLNFEVRGHWPLWNFQVDHEATSGGTYES